MSADFSSCLLDIVGIAYSFLVFVCKVGSVFYLGAAIASG